MVFSKKLITTHLFLTCMNLYGMYDEDFTLEPYLPNTVVYALRGQNGMDSSTDYIRKVIGFEIPVVQVQTPYYLPDLGQYFCQRHLKKALRNETRNIIFYTTAESTATVLNYLANKSNEQIAKKVKAVILETVLASGNSAIYHKATEPFMEVPWIKNIPFSYYIAPYIATDAYCGYRPGGEQPIFSVDTLHVNPDIPFILIHSKKDFQLSYNDACALYYRLKINSYKNVYFMPQDGYKHIHILENSPEQREIVQRILKKNIKPYLHEAIYNNEDELAVYQPDHEQFKHLYAALIKKENIIWHGERVAITAAAIYFSLMMDYYMYSGL